MLRRIVWRHQPARIVSSSGGMRLIGFWRHPIHNAPSLSGGTRAVGRIVWRHAMRYKSRLAAPASAHCQLVWRHSVDRLLAARAQFIARPSGGIHCATRASGGMRALTRNETRIAGKAKRFGIAYV